MKRVQANSGVGTNGKASLAERASKVFGGLKNIVDHCCVALYDDGQPRAPGWISVRTDGPNWTVTAGDPDSGSKLRASAPTLDDALALLDLLLGSDSPPWEVDPYAARQGRRKSSGK